MYYQKNTSRQHMQPLKNPILKKKTFFMTKSAMNLSIKNTELIKFNSSGAVNREIWKFFTEDLIKISQ